MEEFTTGGSDEETDWDQLSDPEPLFVGSALQEAEGCSTGTNCTFTIHAPDAPGGSQSGDVLIMSLEFAASTITPPTIPAGWTILPISNMGGATSMQSHDSCGVFLTSWLLTYVYGSTAGDTGSYQFTHSGSSYNTCLGTVIPEMLGFLVDYRGASSTLSNYSVYGYPGTTDGGSFSVGPATLTTTDATLLNIWASPGLESESNEFTLQTFTAPQGTPTLIPETPLANTWPFLAADVPAPKGGTFGPYSTTGSGNCTSAGCLWFGWQVEIPEQ